MKARIVVVALVALCFLGVRADALVFPLYVQDNFTLTFGADGQPGAAGGFFSSQGHIINGVSAIQCWYTLGGTTQLGAQLSGDGLEYLTTYGVGSTLNMWANPTYTGLLWTGTGSATTHVLVSGGTYPVSWYHPSPNLQNSYNSIGDGFYGGGVGSGAWAGVTQLYVPWFGTYQWNTFDTDADGMPNGIVGNIQGAINDVPEPGTLLLLAGGLVALAFVRRRK